MRENGAEKDAKRHGAKSGLTRLKKASGTPNKECRTRERVERSQPDR
jgi:hypothetical protein